MKSPIPHLSSIFALTGCLLVGSLSSSHAQTTYLWDTNGATSGFGANPRDGTWGTDAFWTTSSTGNTATIAWPGIVRPSVPDIASFQGGDGTITVNGTQTALLVQASSVSTSLPGTFTLSGGTINLETTHNNRGLSALSVGSGGASNSLTVNSAVTLGLDATGASGTRLIIFNAENTFANASTGNLTNTFTLGGNVTVSAAARDIGHVIAIRASANALSTATAIQTSTSVISNGAAARIVSLEFGARSGNLGSARVEARGTSNTYTGTTQIGVGTIALYGDALVSTNGVFGNSSTALSIGNGVAPATEETTLVTNGARTVNRAITIGTGASSNILYGVTLGGETADTSTFGGNINLAFSGARTTKVSLTAASGGAVNFTGILSNSTPLSSVPIEKIGAGIVALSGANTYSGGTTVTTGTLLVNNLTGSGTGTGSVTVSSGAILGGSGTISGATTIASGGFLRPGNSPGNITFGNNLTLAGTYTWELGALSTASPGVNFDTAIVSAGNVNITGASFVLSLGSFAPTNVSFWQVDQTWAGILNNTGGGSLTGSFGAIDNTSWSLLGSFATQNVNNDVNLVWTAVPEPSVYTMLIGALGALLHIRRRRQS